MDNKLLKTFIAVANHSSFTGAAKELYIAQSAVSKHINQLERELGAQLFLRDSRMVRLTAVGESFYKDSVDILNRMDMAVEGVRRLSANGAGSLRMGSFSVLSSEIVALARGYRAQYPNTDLSLDWYEFGDLMSCLDGGDLDVAFTIAFELMDRPQLRCQTVEKGRMFVLLGQGSPLAGSKELRLKDLAELSYHTMRPDVTPNGYLTIMTYFADKGFAPKDARRHTSHESMMLQIQISDNGFGLMGDFQYREHPGLVFVPLAEQDQPAGDAFDLVVAWHTRNENPCIGQLLEGLGHSQMG